MKQCNFIGLLFLLLLVPSVDALNGPQAGRVLYRELLPSGDALVIRQSALVPISALKGLIEAPHIDSMKGLCSITVEIESPPNDTVVVWSQHQFVYELAEYDATRVLDVLAMPGRIYFVLEANYSMNVYQVGVLGYQRGHAGLAAWDRLVAAGVYGEPNRFTAELSFNGEAKRLEAEVVYTRDEGVYRAIYHQKEADNALPEFEREWHRRFEMEPVKVWKEPPPAGKDGADRGSP